MQIETKKRYASREILSASIGDTIAQRGKIWLKQTTEELKDNPIEADKCAQNIAFSTAHVAILNGRDMRTDRYYARERL